MSRSTLLKVSVFTSREAEEAVVEMMSAVLDQLASSYFDFESGETSVSVYLEPPASAAKLRPGLKGGLETIRNCGLDVAPARIVFEKVTRKQWAEAWKRHFKPISVGSALLVKPSWSLRKARRGQSVVILDPGLSFGTGQHPTTRFCLEQVTRLGLDSANPSLLDIGTGSGILAIAAAKLRFRYVEAFDFDPEAVRIAGANAKRNRVLERIHFSRSDVTKLSVKPERHFDMVCANLTSDLLVAEAARIASRVRGGGTLVLAGILSTQFHDVERRYAELGWKIAVRRREGEWESGAFASRP